MGRKSKNKFIIDEDGFVNVYVNGCCLNPDRQISASGFGIFFGLANTCKVYGPCKRRAKNDAADNQSAYIAVHYAKQLNVNKLCINTASKLVFDAATFLLDYSKENDWLSLFKDHIANRNYFKRFKEAVCDSEMKIKVNYEYCRDQEPHQKEAKHLSEKGVELHCNYSALEVLSLNFNSLNLE